VLCVNVFILVRNSVYRVIPFFVLNRLVGMMLSSSSRSRCLCSSYSGHSVDMCSQVWYVLPHGHVWSSGMLKSL
jgi:hypothetical protein